MALGLVLFVVGCDKTGVHALGRKRDVAGSCTTPTSTWIRSTDVGTEVLLIGSVDPTDDVDQATPRCFAFGTVAHDSSSTLDIGSYTLASGSGTFTYPYHYYYDFEASKPILQRTGSVRDDLDPPTEEALAFELDTDGTLLATLGTELHRFTNLVEVLKKIDPTTPDGAKNLYRVFNLPLMTEQNRMVGFGSAGLTGYINAPGTFVGLVTNSVSISVDSLVHPTVHIVYDNFQDLTGVAIDGEQVTLADLTGSGSMRGTLAFRMLGAGGSADVLFAGSVDYGQITIANGTSSGGNYVMTVQGYGTYDVPYTLANDMDFRTVLPVATP